MRRWLFAVPLCALALGLGRGQRVETAGAFELPIHQGVLVQAVNGQMEPSALNTAIHGNKESDFHQMAGERHFDSAQNPRDICDEWGKGFQRFLTDAVKKAAPTGAWKDELDDRDGALFSFGAASHALQDFYSHTNWVEYYVSRPGWDGGLPPVAPLAGVSCDASALPAELNSGYASVIWFAAQFGHSWCPPTGTPDGFEHCHDDLSKDDPHKDHGAQPLPNDAMTYHEAAVKLAIVSTKEAWGELRRRIVAAYDNADTDGECVYRKLAWGGDESCRRSFRISGHIESDVDWTGSAPAVYRYRGDLNVTFRTLPDGTISGEGTAEMSFTNTSICTGSGSGTVPIVVKGQWSRTEPTGRLMTLSFDSDGQFTETRTCPGPNGPVTFPIEANMVTPNAGLPLKAVKDFSDTLTDRFVLDLSFGRGDMQYRWGKLTLGLP